MMDAIAATCHLCPRPRHLNMTEGVYYLTYGAMVLLDDNTLWSSLRIAAARHPLTDSLRFAVGRTAHGDSPAIQVHRHDALAHEAYTLTVDSHGVAITYRDAAGAFYAMCTLVQLVENSGTALPHLTIEDAPAFATRGYMLDIGRGKVPKLEEILELTDWLASMKINHLELYFEGVPFEYPSFPHMWQGMDIMTGEDILALDAFCRARFIELVPTQNHFGHMDKWLYREYRHLAECPDGFHHGENFLPHPRCLNPLDPESETFVHTLEDDLLPYFSSKHFNVSCDETLELGQGHAKEACEQYGMGQVYLDFLMKVKAGADRHGRQILFWDDIIKHYPDLLPSIPSDAITLEWGYLADQPTAADCALMQKTGVRYYTCPGTGAWNTLLGKTDQMIANIRNAAEYGQQYGAEGLLNTDWGDSGHLQSIATSYSGIAYGAAMAWAPSENRDMDLAGLLNTLIFKDAAGVMGQLVLDAGNYFKVEGTMPVNITHSFLLLLSGLDATALVQDTTQDDYLRVTAYIDELSERLTQTDLRCKRATLVIDEYRLALSLIRLMQTVGLYHHAVKNDDTDAQVNALAELCRKLPALIGEVRRTWLLRNRYSYLDESLIPLTTMLRQAEEKSQALKA